MTKRTLLAWGTLAVCLASPAAAQNREHQQMAAELRMLQEQSQQLAITLATLSQTLAESIKLLNARIEDSNNAMKKAFADQKLLIDNMANDVGVARERAGDTNVRITSLQEEVEALRLTVQAFQQAAAAAAVPLDPNAPVDPNAPAPAAPAVALPPPPSAAGLSPNRLFETARADFFAGQWDAAISGFQTFLQAFPKTELADDAQFNIADTYFSQNKFAEAIVEYDKVITGYPNTNSVPLAYYKRGMSQERLGQTDAARQSWETVVKMAPESDPGRLAKQRLSATPAAPR